MDENASIGAAVTNEGDIEGVFKNPDKNETRRALDGVMPQLIEAGGKKLDCYGKGLVRNYERYGFIPVARVEFNPEYANPGWDESKGRPDIYFMMHNGDSAAEVVANIGNYEHMSLEQLESLPEFDYDGALDYRDSLLEKQKADNTRYSSRDSSYMPLAEKYANGTATITASMGDPERAAILRDKSITAADYLGQAEVIIANERENLDSGKIGLVKSALKRAAQEFGLPKSLINDDMDMTVEVSIGSLKESANKQIDNAEQLIKLLPVLDGAVQNAVGIETHENRYYFDDATVRFVNLLGGFSEGDNFIPVRFGIKASKDGTNNLYVLISNQGIKKAEVIKSRATDNSVAPDSRSTSEISLPLLARKINTPDILKYLPDDFLSDRQKKAKWKAVADTVKYTNGKNDTKYREYLEKGDVGSLQRMIEVAAKANGYTIKAWHGTTALFNVFRKGDIGYHVGSKEQAEDRVRGLENARIMPLFVKANNLLEIGMDYENWGGSNVALMLLETEVFEDDPDIEDKLRKILKIDRAKGKETTSQRQNRALRELLQSLGYDGIVYENAFEGHSKLHSGDNKSYILFDPSQLKSADPVTYDSDGNIIPLSERFRTDRTGDEAWKNEDIRYSYREAKAIGYEALLEKYFNRTLNRSNPIYIGEYSIVTLSFFDSNAPLMITASDLTKSTREKKDNSRSAHSITKQFLETLPIKISESVIGYTEDRDGVGSFTIVVYDKDTNSLYAVGGELNAVYEGETVNRIRSIFKIGSPAQFLAKEGKSLVTTDKKTAKNILEKAGIQSPALQDILNRMRIVHERNGNVNTQNRSSLRSSAYLVNSPRVDTKAVEEAVKDGQGTVEDRFDVTVNKSDNGFTVSIADRETGKTYSDRAGVDDNENVTAKAAEHYELYPGTMLGAVPDYLKKLEIAMDENIRSGRNLSYLLNRVLEGVKNMGDPNQVDMFGGMYDLSTEEAVNAQKEKIVDRAIKATEEWKAQRAEEAKRYSSRDAAYMPLAEKYRDGTATEEDAWKNEDIRYSRKEDDITLDDIRAIQAIGKKSINDFSSDDVQKAEKWARKFWKNIGPKSPFFRAWFGDWRAHDNTPIAVATNLGVVRGRVKNVDTGWDINVSGQVFNETKVHQAKANKAALPYLQYINDIVKNAVLLDTFVSKNGGQSLFMHSLYAVADIGNGRELLKLYVEELNNPNSTTNINRAYELRNIENWQSGVTGSRNNSNSPIAQAANIGTIAQLFEAVKQRDSSFTPKPVDFHFLNEDGTPKIFYHGTDADFTEFDPSKGRANMDIQGMFFSPWEIDAAGYGKKVGAYYLSIQNPAPEGVAYKALNKFKGQNNAGVKARQYLESLGYDGVNNNDEEFIAFYPWQIKSATDNIGTFDRFNNDTRYSSRADSDIALWNPPDVDTRGIYEAVKNGSGKVDGRFDVTVETGNNGFNVTIKDTQTGETYKDGGNIIPLSERFRTDRTGDEAWKNEDIRYSSRVADESTLDFLNGQKTMKVYRAMQVIDGKLYPPMAAKVKDENGKWSLQEPTEIGAWYQSEERPDLADENGFFVLNKGNGTSLKARYNPYWHTSATPLNDQFSSAYNRPNLVTVEGEIPVSELTSGYRAEKAKDSVGETKWHAGPVASKLKGDKARRVYLSRWFKATRVVPDSEVAQIIAETLKGEDISVPSNVVTPSLLAELRKQGVPIEEIEGKGGIAEDRYSRRGPAKYAPRDIANVTEKDYNDHAWTYYNKVLDNHALSVFSNAISDIKNGFRYPKTWDGKYIIPTGADNGIYNQLVVTNGRYGNASIEAVINIGLNNETELAPIRRAINDYLKEGFSYDEVDSIIEAIKGQGILSLHRQEDFPSLQALRRQRRDSGKADSSDRAMQDGAGSVGENRTVLSDTRITDTQAPDNGAFSSPENRRSSRADSDIALWNPPDVDMRGIYEAVKNDSGKVDGRFDVTVDAGNNGFNVTIKDTQTGETYKDGATVEAGENAEAFAERYTAAIIRNIKSGRPESTSRSTAGIYIEKGENPVRDVNIPVFDVNGDKVRRFMRTVEESGAIPDDMVDDIKKDIMAGGESYKPISNKSALAAFQQNGKRRPRSKLPGVLIRFSAETAPLPSSACRAR